MLARGARHCLRQTAGHPLGNHARLVAYIGHEVGPSRRSIGTTPVDLMRSKRSMTGTGVDLQQGNDSIDQSGEIRSPSDQITDSLNVTLSAEEKAAARHFQHLGINEDLSQRIVLGFPQIRKPTLCQRVSLKAIRKPSDILLRAHTASGKSLGVLIALLNQHPMLFREVKNELLAADGRAMYKRDISSIIIVPSRELAIQYGYWTEQLVPEHFRGAVPSIVAVKYRNSEVPVSQHVEDLMKRTPRILVITANLLKDIIRDPRAEAALNIPHLRTLVLDEADALFDLPGRFPRKKAIWKHLKHPPAGLTTMNWIMERRCTFSSGSVLPMSGLEIDEPQIGKVPKMSKRVAHLGRRKLLAREKRMQRGERARIEDGKEYDRENKVIMSRERRPGEKPMQLIAMSATANAVMRHFLGARSGWLRPGLRDWETKEEMGKWIDLTGLSQGVNKADEMEGVRVLPPKTPFPLQIPREIKHYCVVVDQPFETTDVNYLTPDDSTKSQLRWRNLDMRLKTSDFRVDDDLKRRGNEQLDVHIDKTRPPLAPEEKSASQIDIPILTCLAFIFATQAVRRGMAVVPASYSLTRTIDLLKKLGVPAKPLLTTEDANYFARRASKPIGIDSNEKLLPSEADRSTSAAAEQAKGDEPAEDAGDEVLHVLNSASVRGLDIPDGISHVFIVGMDAGVDSTMYIHIAGRVSRLGSHHEDSSSHSRPPGAVITLLRGMADGYVKENLSYYNQGRFGVQDVTEVGQSDIQDSNRAAKVEEDEGDSRPRHITSANEMKMAVLYKRLSLPVSKIHPLSLGEYAKVYEEGS